MTLRVLLAGQEAAGARTLRALTRSGHEVAAVLTQEPVVVGGPASLSGLAEKLALPVLPARRVREPSFASQVRAWGVDVLLNVHSLHIVADEVLEAPTIGSFNLHPGPLPEYAGLNTVGWAIYNGEREYGVTVHWMAPKVDAGPIVFQERFEVGPNPTPLTLSGQCARVGAQLLGRVLERAATDPRTIPAEAQDLSKRRYYARGQVPQDGRVDWAVPVDDLLRFTRCFEYGPFASPWGRPLAEIDGELLEVAGLARTGVASDEPPGTARHAGDGPLWVACSDEWVSVGRVFSGGEPVEVGTLLAGA